MSYRYSVDYGYVIIFDDVQYTVYWKGKIEDKDAEVAVQIPNSEDAIVLLNSRQFEGSNKYNLVRIDSEGNIVYRAELPDDALEWYSMILSVNDKEIVANSYSGWFTILDVNTGNIKSKKFFK